MLEPLCCKIDYVNAINWYLYYMGGAIVGVPRADQSTYSILDRVYLHTPFFFTCEINLCIEVL